MIKRCARCGKKFDARRNAKYCIECRVEVKREQQRRWLKANPEKKREYTRRWEKAHPEKIREYKRRYYAAHREEILADQRQRYEQKRLKLERQRTLAKFLEWRKQHENHRTDR